MNLGIKRNSGIVLPVYLKIRFTLHRLNGIKKITKSERVATLSPKELLLSTTNLLQVRGISNTALSMFF